MPTAFRFTSKDLEELPKWEGIYYEIIDGELHVTTARHLHHQYVIGSLGAALHNWSGWETLGESVPGPGLVLAPDQDVIPDLFWITNDRLTRALDENGHLTIAPELIVEVLSPGPMHECRDRVVKLSLYSRQGVDEYWIVDWQARQVEVYRRDEAELRLVESLTADAVLASPLLPGFACQISKLWHPTY